MSLNKKETGLERQEEAQMTQRQTDRTGELALGRNAKKPQLAKYNFITKK